MKVRKLTDNEVQAILRKLRIRRGVSEGELDLIVQAAKAQGLTPQDIIKLIKGGDSHDSKGQDAS